MTEQRSLSLTATFDVRAPELISLYGKQNSSAVSQKQCINRSLKCCKWQHASSFLHKQPKHVEPCMKSGFWRMFWDSMMQRRRCLKHTEFKIFLSLPLSELIHFSLNSLCCWCFGSKVKVTFMPSRFLSRRSDVLWNHLCTRKWSTYWLHACDK